MKSENRDAELIFGEALRLNVPAERAAYLDQACAGNQALRQEVESLLNAFEHAGDFFSRRSQSAPSDFLAERPGTMVDRYKLLEKIGEGGFGIVYMAEQEEPVRRRVALKIIKVGMDTREVVARFEAERQALAMMDHPNIARVFDGGATELGRPFFVMELVKGISITEYCDANRLSTRERLELFIQVCHAIQHAHQKGVIHRDLKPSNVLVTVQDGQPMPKVIDFGVAKATQAQLTEKTVFTRFRQWIGTPAYMSPEQAGLGNLDVDTRSDVYSLGVLLYELLTGQTPFDAEKMLAAGYDAVMQTIREEDPPKPSTRLSTLAREELSAVAARRSAEPAKLGGLIRGDLDWIVMKCLEKDRQRRYETATGLAQDIERHLSSEPVTAGAPGAMYRLGKFMRRHRFGLATATALVLLLVMGVVASTWQAVRATRAEKQTYTVATFLQDTLTSVTPEEAKGRDTKLLLELVDKAAARVDKKIKGQPEIEAWLRDILGEVYLKLGLYPQAEPLLIEALRQRERILGKDHPETLRSVNNLAVLLFQKADYTAAEPLSRRALEARERTLGKDHPDTLMSVNNLAALLSAKGDYTGAEPLYRRAMEAQERMLGKDHPDTLMSLKNLAVLLFQKADYSGAELLCRRALQTEERTLGKDHPDTLKSVNNLANLLSAKADYAGAEQLYHRVLEARGRTLGKDHPDTLGSVYNLAIFLVQKGNYTGAEPLSRRALEAQERTLGKDHPDTLLSVNNLANLLFHKGDYTGAELLYRRALEAQERRLGGEHPETLMSVNNLATLLKAKGDYSGAEPLYHRAMETMERTLGRDHPYTLKSVNNLANFLKAKGDYTGAEPLYRRALDARERTLGKEHPDTLDSVNDLANLLSQNDDYAGAERLYRRALEARERTLGKEHPATLGGMNDLAALLSAKGDYTGAEPLYRQVLEARERRLGKEHPDTLTSVNNLAALLSAKGDYTGAEPLYRRALEARERTLGKDHPDTLTSVNNLANLLSAKGDSTGAEPLYRRALEAQERILGKEHPDTLTSVGNLAGLLQDQGDLAGSELLCRRALEARERTLGKEHPDTLTSVNNLAQLLSAKGDYTGSEPLYRRALEARERTLGKEHPDTLTSVNNLAHLLSAKEDYTGAEPLYRRALGARERTLGKEHPDTLTSMKNLATLLLAQGKSAEAMALLRRSMKIQFGPTGRDGQSREETMTAIAQAIEKSPSRGNYLMYRAFVFGQQGQWQGAVTDLSQIAKADVRWSLALGPLLVEIGDTNSYNRHRSMVSVTSWGEDPETAAEAAMEMSVQPKDGGWSAPAELAEIAVVGGTNHARLPYFQLVKGLVEYRQGHYVGAVDWTQRSLAGSGTNYTTAAAAGAVLAMAQEQLKQAEAARQAFAQANEVFETRLPKPGAADLGENWPEWLISHILLREANGLVEKK